MYASGLFKVVDKHLKSVHTYPDDIQFFVSFKPTSQANTVNAIEKWIADVRNWMASNRIYDHRFSLTIA